MYRGLAGSSSPLSISTLAIWDMITKKHKLAPFPSPLSSLGEHQDFFGPWGGSMEVRCFQFLVSTELKPLAVLREKWGTSPSDSWRHLLLRGLFRNLRGIIRSKYSLTTFVALCTSMEKLDWSQLYQLLIEFSLDGSILNCRLETMNVVVAFRKTKLLKLLNCLL